MVGTVKRNLEEPITDIEYAGRRNLHRVTVSNPLIPTCSIAVRIVLFRALPSNQRELFTFLMSLDLVRVYRKVKSVGTVDKMEAVL